MRTKSLEENFGCAASIERPARKNHRAHHVNETLFKGVIQLPKELLAEAGVSPLYRTTCGKEVIRGKYKGITFIFRDFSILTDTYNGEIVKTPDNKIRFHLYKIIKDVPARYIVDKIAIEALNKLGVQRERG